ncbi:MAG TPA: 5-oxoprolinase subunit PxpA [Thermoanaerobaculia bacterium]|nr:5-oxoprolinase subunit PxpA [Thermoanaerobaculia bacterium]
MIDLSADLGEGSPGEDEIWPLITSANVACGGHTGDGASMEYAALQAKRYGVKLGAHPSYPDLANFGRKSMQMEPRALRATLVEQIAGLQEIAERHGVGVVHVKPHGALYNDAHRDRALADTIVEALRELDETIALVCPDASQMAAAARAAGTPVIREAFADRRYNADGSLVSRKEANALLNVDEAVEQAALLVSDGAVVAADGTRVRLAFDTICIHADMERAVERLRAIRQRLGGNR